MSPSAPSQAAEASHWASGRPHVAGCDEAGRGCLGGPVVAAAVLLPRGAVLPGLDDSKRLSPEMRAALFPRIRAVAVGVGVGACSPEEIDAMNILRASLEAMRRAVAALPVVPDAVLVDGNRAIPDAPWPQETLVGGDGRSLAIAAASVVAKVTRDGWMEALDADEPAYGWARHKGYPTAAHYAALAEHGPGPHHRRTFRLHR